MYQDNDGGTADSTSEPTKSVGGDSPTNAVQHAERIADQNVDRHAEQIAVQNTDQNVEQIADQSADRNAEQIADQNAEQIADKNANYPKHRSAFSGSSAISRLQNERSAGNHRIKRSMYGRIMP